MIDRSAELMIDTAVLEAQCKAAIERVKMLKRERDEAVAAHESLRSVAIALVSFQAIALVLVAAYLYWRSM